MSSSGTQGAWSKKTVNGFMVGTCIVTQSNSDNDAYTLKIPAGYIDGTKPWVMFQTASASADGASLPLDIWIGYDDNFALSGSGAVTAVNGAMYKQVYDDCVLAITTKEYAYHMHPDLGVADVVTVSAINTGNKINCPPAPYYALNLDGGGTLNDAIVMTWVVVQKL